MLKYPKNKPLSNNWSWSDKVAIEPKSPYLTGFGSENCFSVGSEREGLFYMNQFYDEPDYEAFQPKIFGSFQNVRFNSIVEDIRTPTKNDGSGSLSPGK